ncbi:MAG: cell envelope integrity protein TolA [Burkholderiales bacterium]|nr:cell envelope integrity protein TolA [Burkholderiales bacterium]
MTYPPPTSNHHRSPLLERTEPGKWPAALLAFIVHGGFFALIVFGVSWQVKLPEPAIAELWDQLPPIRNVVEAPVTPAPPPEPEPDPPKIEKVVEPKIEPKVEKAPPQPSKADIQLQAKREKLEKAEREKKMREEKALVEKQKLAEVEKKRKDDEAKLKAAQKVAEDRLRAEQAAKDAAAASVRNAAQADYANKIAKLIRDRANIPDSVTGRPEVSVRLRLLVNGVILDAQVVKPSGDKVYDDAVERAINGIRNWPQPENADLFGGRRELNLNIRHER